MKKFISLCILFSFISCTEIVGDVLSNVIDNSIDNLVDDSLPDFDTFIKIENTSYFELEGLEITFDNQHFFYSYIFPAQHISEPFGYYHITDSPYISFHIANQHYELNFKDNINSITSGSYLLKITIQSNGTPTIMAELIEQDY